MVSSLRRISGKVFAWAVPAFDLEDVRSAGNVYDQYSVLDLCFVCKDWRNAAIGTHVLWTRVRFPRSCTPLEYEKVRVWLEHAGGLPRAVTVASCSERHFLCTERKQSWPLQIRASPTFFQVDPCSALSHLSLQCTSSQCV